MADGQLDGDQFKATVDAVLNDPQAQDAWDSFHMVGDLLRSADLAGAAANYGFTARWSARLQQELLTEQPSQADWRVDVKLPIQAVLPVSPVASNDDGRPWKWAAAVASVVAVVAVSWAVRSTLDGRAAELAQRQPVMPQATTLVASTTADGPQVMLRDPKLDELLLAHRQIGAMSALQSPSGFLRNATFQEPAR